MKVILFLLIISCSFSDQFFKLNERRLKQPKKTVIALQPLDNFDKRKIENIKESLSEFWHRKVIVLPIRTIPARFYTPSIEAYSSDSLLSFLSNIKKSYFINIVGMTHKNLYTVKYIQSTIGYFDPGIFGNGDLPGNCCIVSDYKLGGITDQEYDHALCNSIIHEMGHNYGLSHCQNSSCIMSEQKGAKIVLIRGNLDFCDLCRSKLKSFDN